MEQVESIPFSGLIAGMLLYKRSCTSVEVINVLSRLEDYGIVVDDENDDLGIISCCVEMSLDCGFCLKNGFCYGTVLIPGVKVSDFLKIHTNDKILSIIGESIEYFRFQETTMMQVMNYESVKERKGFSSIKNKILSRKKKDYECITFRKGKNSIGKAIFE